MRTVLIFSTLLLFSQQAYSGNWMYNRLNKLYQTDRSLCLEKSKKYMGYFKQSSIPHYFASSIYYDQSKESQTLRGMYLHMNRSLNEARKFEQLSDETEQALVHWDEHTAALKNRVVLLIKKLDESDQRELSAQLRSNIQKVASINYSEDITSITGTPTSIAPETHAPLIRLEGQLYGLATGTENIPSASIENEQQLLQLINNARLNKGLPPLSWNEDLARASRYHAFDLGSQHYFDHTSYDRYEGELVKIGSPFERIRMFYTATRITSENIAAGNENPSATYQQWYNSKGHHDNMFNPQSRYIGIGVCYVPDSPYEYYWVMSTAE